MIIESKTVTPEKIAADNAAASKETVTEPVAAAVKTDVQAETAEDSGAEEQTQEEKDALAATAAEETEEEESEEPESKEPAAKPLKGFKKRIDKLSKRASLAEQERDALRVQVEQMRAGALKPVETKVDPKKTASDEPQADAFETHAEYVKALTKWQVNEARSEDEKKQTATQRQTEEQKILKRWNDGQAAAEKKFPDWEEVKESIADSRISPAMQQIFLESDNGAELAYHLAKNPKEWERINALSPQAAAREFGKFEASLPKATASESKKTSTAPDPIRPLGSGKAQVAKKTIYDKGLTQREYEALRNEQIAKRDQR